MKRTLNGKLVRYKLPQPSKRRPRAPYKSKAYAALKAQLQLIRLAEFGGLFADAIHSAAMRPGFVRRILDPQGADLIEKENQVRIAERTQQREEQKRQLKAAYETYYVPYHRNRLKYNMVPDHVMSDLGLSTATKSKAVVMLAAAFR